MQTFFCRVAGVDPVALEGCPLTDRVWAAHLGFALVLNFVVVFGLSFYAVGYFVTELYVRILVAIVVAAVLTTFDRALFQFDWFTVALLHEARGSNRDRATPMQRVWLFARPFWRLSLRLLISLAIAYTLSVFTELAVFDHAIREKMASMNFAENGPYREKLLEFEKGFDEKLAARLSAISRLEAEITSLQRDFVSRAGQDEYDVLRKGAAEARARIAAIERSLADNESRMRELNEDIYAERYGLRDKPYRTGRPGCIPPSVCYDLTITVKDMREENDKLRKEVETLQVRAQDLDAKASDYVKRRNASDNDLLASKRKELELLRLDASAFDAQRHTQLANYEAQLKQNGTYRPLRDDPIIRIGILDELRHDPMKGSAISEMSYLIKAFIAFLELAPVLAKVFFAPPTVYSARVRATVVVGQVRALRTIGDCLHIVDAYGANELPKLVSRPMDRSEKLEDPELKELVIPDKNTALVPLPRSSFATINQIGVSWLAEWIGTDSERKRATGDYYAARLASGQLLTESDLAIVDYCRAHFGSEVIFFELGFGLGEVSLCLALSGYRTVGFESEAGRYDATSALATALARHGYETGSLSLVFGVFPDVLRLNWSDLDGESVFVSTNVTSSLMMEAINKVVLSLRRFDHLIIDLSRFGEVRDVQSQLDLVAKLQELGFDERTRVYSLGDTDIRHFTHKRYSGSSQVRVGEGEASERV